MVYYRVLRSDLIATLQEEYITMARSKGISSRRIMWRHAFRPSTVALCGTAGVNIGGLLAGGFIVQFILAMPGLGYQLIAAIGRSDYLVVQGSCWSSPWGSFSLTSPLTSRPTWSIRGLAVSNPNFVNELVEEASVHTQPLESAGSDFSFGCASAGSPSISSGPSSRALTADQSACFRTTTW